MPKFENKSNYPIESENDLEIVEQVASKNEAPILSTNFICETTQRSIVLTPEHIHATDDQTPEDDLKITLQAGDFLVHRSKNGDMLVGEYTQEQIDSGELVHVKSGYFMDKAYFPNVLPEITVKQSKIKAGDISFFLRRQHQGDSGILVKASDGALTTAVQVVTVTDKCPEKTSSSFTMAHGAGLVALGLFAYRYLTQGNGNVDQAKPVPTQAQGAYALWLLPSLI